MEKFKENGYDVIGSGKILHHNKKGLNWNRMIRCLSLCVSLESYIDKFNINYVFPIDLFKIQKRICNVFSIGKIEFW